MRELQQQAAKEYCKKLEYQLALAMYYEYDFVDVLTDKDLNTKFIGWVGNEPHHEGGYMFSERYDLRDIDYQDLKNASERHLS